MKLNNRAKAFLAVGILFVVATVIIFSIANSGLNSHKWLGIIFLLFAELVFFFGGAAIESFAGKTSQIFMRTGNGIILAGYSVLVFVSALSFLLIDDWGVRAFWILQILLFVLMAALEISFVVAGKSVHESSKKTLDSVTAVNEMVDSLTLLESNAVYKKQVEKLAEDLRYTDISTIVPVDDDILIHISKLEAEFLKDEVDGKKVDSILEDISVLIKKRKIQVKSTKGGSI